MQQGGIGSCVWNAMTAVLRWHIKRHGGPDHELSRLQGYYDTRTIENSINEDAGCEIRNAIKCAQKVGVGHESLWPYVEARFREAPPASVYNQAGLFGSLTYERVPISMPSLKAALGDGVPVIIGVTLFSSFESNEVQKTGIVPMPQPDKEHLVGGHAMYCIGYGKKPGYFTVVNSWGAGWGDSGLCYFPEEYLGSEKYGGDYWLIRNAGDQ